MPQQKLWFNLEYACGEILADEYVSIFNFIISSFKLTVSAKTAVTALFLK